MHHVIGNFGFNEIDGNIWSFPNGVTVGWKMEVLRMKSSFIISKGFLSFVQGCKRWRRRVLSWYESQ